MSKHGEKISLEKRIAAMKRINSQLGILASMVPFVLIAGANTQTEQTYHTKRKLKGDSTNEIS